jgi:hypothetical protein
MFFLVPSSFTVLDGKGSSARFSIAEKIRGSTTFDNLRKSFSTEGFRTTL